MLEPVLYSNFKRSLVGLSADMEAAKDASLEGKDISTRLFQVHQKYDIPLADLESIDFTA